MYKRQPFVGLLLVAATRVNLTLFDVIADEDGVIEWLQFAAYAATAVVALMAARRMLAHGERVPGVLWLLLALLCVFIAGEEISWGQRLLGLETPESIKEVNRQGEIGVHNVFGIEMAFSVMLLTGGLFGTVAPWWPRVRAALGPGADRYVPPLFLTSFFLLVLGHRALRLSYEDFGDIYVFVHLGEWAELCFASGLLIFALLNLRRRGERGEA